MFFSALRRSARECKRLRAELSQARAEIERLSHKLETRTDFFVEREFRLMDRWLTNDRKTYAITDEARRKVREQELVERVGEQDATRHDNGLEVYLNEKLAWLQKMAKEANIPNWKERAQLDFEKNRALYEAQYQDPMQAN